MNYNSNSPNKEIWDEQYKQLRQYLINNPQQTQMRITELEKVIFQTFPVL